MANLIVVKRGSEVWDALDGVRPAPGEWTTIALPESVIDVLGLAGADGRADISASAFTETVAADLPGSFERASTEGTVLLFDEADAVLGRRSEVRDAHDRYAGVEVSYLARPHSARMNRGPE